MARRRRGKTGGGIGALWKLQMQAVKLGQNWAEMSVGAAQVIATRTAMMGAAMTRPAKLADPELALMVTEKMAAVGEAAERLSRRAVRGAGRRRVSRTRPASSPTRSTRRSPQFRRSIGEYAPTFAGSAARRADPERNWRVLLGEREPR